MTTAIGTVGQGEFMSSKSLVEAAKIILSARPEGLSEDMLVHILLLDDRLPLLGGGAHVYGVRKDKSKNSLGNKGLSALRRTKGMRKVEGRWIYTGPPPAAPKVVDGEQVVRDEPSSPSSRCCKGCGAILRRGNVEDYCWPCEPPRLPDPKIREHAEPKPKGPRVYKTTWTKSRIIRAIQRWHAKHGDIPIRSEWEKAKAKGENRPTASIVVKVFGSWGNAIRAAGFVAKTPGQRPGSGHWREVMGHLPGTALTVGAALGREPHLTRHVLTRMERAGWVYRERVDGYVKRGGGYVIWHPVPQGMEKAA